MDRVKNFSPGATTPSLKMALISALILAPHGIPRPAEARPETIRAGVSYYSDELLEGGSVRDIGTARNYEEVFKLYTYYEVLYDENERVTTCLEYKRGDVIRKDIYRYAKDGSLLEHAIEIPGKPTERIQAPAPE